jgi:hypothetical protein
MIRNPENIKTAQRKKSAKSLQQLLVGSWARGLVADTSRALKEG